MLMMYLRMIPLWSSSEGGVQCRATVLEFKASADVNTGGLFGAVDKE